MNSVLIMIKQLCVNYDQAVVYINQTVCYGTRFSMHNNNMQEYKLRLQRLWAKTQLSNNCLQNTQHTVYCGLVEIHTHSDDKKEYGVFQ